MVYKVTLSTKSVSRSQVFIVKLGKNPRKKTPRFTYQVILRNILG